MNKWIYEIIEILNKNPKSKDARVLKLKKLFPKECASAYDTAFFAPRSTHNERMRAVRESDIKVEKCSFGKYSLWTAFLVLCKFSPHQLEHFEYMHKIKFTDEFSYVRSWEDKPSK